MHTYVTRGVALTTVPQWSGMEAKALRSALRMTVEVFAEHLGVSPRTVAKWEKRGADIRPLPELQAALDTALTKATSAEQERFEVSLRISVASPPKVAGQESDMTAAQTEGSMNPSSSAGEVLVRVELLRRAVNDTVGAGSIPQARLDDWEQVALRHGRATRYRPAGMLLVELTADCAELQRLLNLRQPSSSLRRLTRVMAQMAGLMSLTFIKLNQNTASRSWARTARLAADQAGDPATQSWVRAQDAYTAYYSGDLAAAVELGKHAQALAGKTSCVGVALAAALEGRAQARLDRRAETYAALSTADAALTRLDDECIIESAFGYNEAQLRFHEGNALTHLHDTDAAQVAQQRALQLYPDQDYMDRALVRLDRAACLTHDGELEAAMDEATHTLTDLTPGQREGIIAMRAGELLAAIPADARMLSPVRDLLDALELSTD
jgi:transcriptional regulator with XRE-family HTH domain